MKKTIHDLVCYFARPIASKNIVALIVLPFIVLGFLWGFAFIQVLRMTSSTQFKGFLAAFGAESLSVFLCVVPFLVVTFFALYPISKGIQLLMPETFDDSDYEQLDD